METERGEPIYICARCGRKLTQRDFELLHGVRCVYCGCRIIYKARRPGIKRVKAI